MRVRVKIGCLQSEKRLNTRTVLEEYGCRSFNVELPEEGSREDEMPCPVCGEPIALQAQSLEGAQTTAAWWMVLVAAVAGSLGWFLMTASEHQYFQIASWVAFGVCGLSVIGALAAAFGLAAFLVSMGDSVQLTRAPSGHKVIEVDEVRGLADKPEPEPEPEVPAKMPE
jgi:hypothetical protein